MKVLFAVAAMLCAMAAPGAPTWAAPKPGAAAPAASEALTIARRVVAKMRLAEQQRFAITKLAPLFGQALVSGPAETMPEVMQEALQATGGRERVAKMLSDGYVEAIEVRLPQLVEAVAVQIAADMTVDELKGVEAFLDTPVGKKWATEGVALQRAASEAGSRAGAAAGEAALKATLLRLKGQDSKS